MPTRTLESQIGNGLADALDSAIRRRAVSLSSASIQARKAGK